MANANVNGWVESLKRHGGFGDARARQLADYFKSKDIAGDEEAQEHVAGILRRGGSLEQGGNALHSAIHSVLRRDLDIGESSAPKKKVTGTAAPASQPAEKKVAAPAPQSTPKQPAAAAKEQAAETGAEERKIDLEGKKLRLARDQEEAADRAKAKAEAAAAKEKEGKWYSKLGRGIGTGHATVKEYAGYAKSATGQSGTNIFLFFAFFIYVIDSFVTNRIGITNFSFAFKDLISLLGWTFFGILMIIHVLKLKKREGGLDIGEMVSYALALLLIFITAFSGALDRWSYVHLLFIIFFWKYVISEREDKITSNGLLIFMILIDFYFYIILKSANVNMNTIAVAMKLPYLFLFTVWYLKDRVGSKPAIIFFWVIVIVILFYNWSNLYIATTGFTTQIDGMEQINPWQVVKGVGGGIKLFLQDTKTAYAKQLEYATGGYYNSQVEQNTDPNSQLGVYIENLQAADKQFYENEQVTVWGDLKARTLDEPINIYMSCSSGKEKGKIVPDYLAKPEYLTDPKQGYEIAQLEETGFECRFNPGQLAPGSNSVSIKVEFNFNTLAFLKTYFMDIERMRAMRKDNIDPLAQYGITDKAKSSISTYGPIKLGMGTTDPPIGLSQENEVYTFVGITVQNQWPNGRIKNITKLIINTPINLELEPSEDSGSFCRGGFELNLESAGGYTSYKMKDTELQQIKTPITAADFRSFRCPIKIEQGKTSGILGNIPVATYYYRSEASYIYEIEKTLSVFIKNIANETTKLKDCTTECKDTDGCICNSDESCTVAKGIKITKGTSCNTYIAPAQTPSPTTTPPTS